MYFSEMRKSLKSLIGLDSVKTTVEPLIFENLVCNIKTELEVKEKKENRFLSIQQKPPKINQYYVVLEQLQKIYKNQPKSYDFDQLDVLQYNEEKSEKKVNLKMSNARWNQQNDQESEIQNLLQSEILVDQKNLNLESESKQEIVPYYAKYSKNYNKLSQQSQIRQESKENDNKRNVSQIQNSCNSRLNFQRDFQDRKSQSQPPQSSFKRLGGILEEDFYVPSFLQESQIQLKSSKISRINNDNKSPYYKKSRNTINEQEQFNFKLKNQESQISIKDYYNSDNHQEQKKSLIKFETFVPQDENPFNLLSQEVKCPPWQRQSLPPWQIKQSQQNFQEVVQYEDKQNINNFDFLNSQNDRQNQKQQKDNNFRMIQKIKNQKLSADSFCAQNYEMESQSPLEIEYSLLSKSEFQEQTPVFKQNEENKIIKQLYSKSKQKYNQGIQSPQNVHYFRSVNNINQKQSDSKNNNKEKIFQVQEQITPQQNQTNQLLVNQ